MPLKQTAGKLYAVTTIYRFAIVYDDVWYCWHCYGFRRDVDMSASSKLTKHLPVSLCTQLLREIQGINKFNLLSLWLPFIDTIHKLEFPGKFLTVLKRKYNKIYTQYTTIQN